jgi:hypothetical protein
LFIFAVLGWKVVTALFGSVFSDTHGHAVLLVGALLSSSCLILVLWMIGAVARRRSYLLSASSVAKMFGAGVILYLVLLWVAFPVRECL